MGVGWVWIGGREGGRSVGWRGGVGEGWVGEGRV